MIIEMHCHTSERSACSHVAAVELVRKAFQLGIQAIVITDHHYQWNEEELASLRKKSGLPEIFKIFSGQEVTTYDFGDILVYGAPHTVHKQKISLAEVREQNPDAAIIWAHPYRNKKIPHPDKLLSPLHDGVEIFSSNYTISESTHSLHDWHKYKFTAIGGTDTHAYSYTGLYPTVFDHPITSMEDLAKELKAGRCRPFFKEIPKTGTSHTKVTEVTIGPKSAIERKKIIVKTFDDIKAWKSGERSFHIVEQLVRHSFYDGSYRIPKPLEKDARNLSLIEEKVEGDSLFDTIIRAERTTAPKYLEMAANWLSKLHNMRLKITPDNEYLLIEPERLEYYLKSLIETENIHLERVREIKDLVLEKEIELIRNRPENLVQGHGDFHPKNILIGKDERDKKFVAVIDFDSSYQLPRAFDVGTFLAQYINMFFGEHYVQLYAPSDIFLETYLATADKVEDDFMAQVNLYIARTCLSILYYLAKVGMGSSENFWRILVEAEKNLSSIKVKHMEGTKTQD